jgi:putative membrane protein
MRKPVSIPAGILVVLIVLNMTTVYHVVASGTPNGDTFTVSPPAISDEDRAFMIEAATGGMAEVEMGRLAATKARSAAVKRFGRRMVTDHSRANAELKRLAKRKGVALPTDLTPEQKADKEKLSNLSGAEFDREYMSMMVADHDKDVNAFEAKAGNAADRDLKRFVVKTLPTLKMHQKMAKQIKANQ